MDLELNMMRVCRSTCDFCLQEHPEWAEDVGRQMARSYPDYDPKRGYPANHPLWDELDRLWKPHQVTVISWENDDGAVDVCARHLAQILAMMLDSNVVVDDESDDRDESDVSMYLNNSR
jgi:hypothetical protein